MRHILSPAASYHVNNLQEANKQLLLLTPCAFTLQSKTQCGGILSKALDNSITAKIRLSASLRFQYFVNLISEILQLKTLTIILTYFQF